MLNRQILALLPSFGGIWLPSPAQVVGEAGVCSTKQPQHPCFIDEEMGGLRCLQAIGLAHNRQNCSHPSPSSSKFFPLRSHPALPPEQRFTWTLCPVFIKCRCPSPSKLFLLETCGDDRHFLLRGSQAFIRLWMSCADRCPAPGGCGLLGAHPPCYLSAYGALPSPHCFRLDGRWVRPLDSSGDSLCAQ